MQSRIAKTGMSLLLAVLLGTVSACKNKGPVVPEDLTPVRGVVTLDGKPLGGVVVTFSPENETGTAAAGTTDQEGRFQLTSFPTGNGARPGNYKVLVTSRADASYSRPTTLNIPPVYSNIASTPFTIAVPISKEVVLPLRSKPKN
jgi:hypothetical protein